ncbi:MAG: hypothetical protein HQL38_08155 [Alphaproteobacteria bacterium]|nr:hypothetical protein [Alphaproteobacteria bacterium]
MKTILASLAVLGLIAAVTPAFAACTSSHTTSVEVQKPSPDPKTGPGKG